MREASHPDNLKGSAIGVYLSPGTEAEVRAAATLEDRSLSSFVRRAIIEALKKARER